MTRQEHLDWAKKRAIEYLNSGDTTGAFSSMASDLQKHPETAGHVGIKLGLLLMMTGNLHDMRKWIEGFN